MADTTYEADGGFGVGVERVRERDLGRLKA